MSHDITLSRPEHYGPGAYDDFAERLIKALLVRLSVLPHTKKDCVKAFVSDLTQKGEICIKVLSVAVRSPNTNPEATRQAFLLAIHNVCHTLIAKEAADAASETSQQRGAGVPHQQDVL